MENKSLQITSELDLDQEEIEIVGINTICRLCASQNERLIGIFSDEGIGNDLLNKINLYLPIKVAASDELPQQCCWNCASTILAWHELVVTAVETDRRFRGSQVIPEKHIIEDGYDNSANCLSDDNEGWNSAEGNIMAIFQQINKQKSPQLREEETQCISTPQEPPLQCEICEKTLSSKSNHISHVKTHLSDYYCTICCNSYNTKFKLDTHFTIHSGQDNTNFVRCDLENCNQEFPSKLQLYNHKNSHLNVTKLKCDICELKFSRKAALENHKSRHSAPPICGICGKQFANKKTLKEHYRLHTGEKPFECQQCSKKFRCHSGLKYHEISHSSERKYACKVCGLSFLRSNYLKEHLNRHLNEKPYSCKHCSEKFTQSNVLKRHEMKMHVACDVCKVVVGRAKSVRHHKWKQHNVI